MIVITMITLITTTIIIHWEGPFLSPLPSHSPCRQAGPSEFRRFSFWKRTLKVRKVQEHLLQVSGDGSRTNYHPRSPPSLTHFLCSLLSMS